MSPSLNYKTSVRGTMGAFRGGSRAYYAPLGSHPVVDCPDCGHKADADFGDHFGACIGTSKLVTPTSALGIIRRFALANRRFSANDLRAAFDQAGVKPTSRGPAFATAQRRQWIECDGYVRSTDPGTKRHPVATYESCIYTGAPQ